MLANITESDALRFEWFSDECGIQALADCGHDCMYRYFLNRKLAILNNIIVQPVSL